MRLFLFSLDKFLKRKAPLDGLSKMHNVVKKKVPYLFGNPAVIALSLRPVVLRPRFSAGLPFHLVSLSNVS